MRCFLWRVSAIRSTFNKSNIKIGVRAHVCLCVALNALFQSLVWPHLLAQLIAPVSICSNSLTQWHIQFIHSTGALCAESLFCVWNFLCAAHVCRSNQNEMNWRKSGSNGGRGNFLMKNIVDRLVFTISNQEHITLTRWHTHSIYYWCSVAHNPCHSLVSVWQCRWVCWCSIHWKVSVAIQTVYLERNERQKEKENTTTE